MFGGRFIAAASALAVLVGCGELEAADPRSREAEAPVATDPAQTATGSAAAYTPQVVLAVPSEAAYARPDVVVKLLFSMPMDTEITAAAFTVTDEDDQIVDGTLQWDVTHMVSAFRPDSALAEGHYRARVDAAACNDDGIELTAPFVTDFHIHDSSDDKPYAG